MRLDSVCSLWVTSPHCALNYDCSLHYSSHSASSFIYDSRTLEWSFSQSRLSWENPEESVICGRWGLKQRELQMDLMAVLVCLSVFVWYMLYFSAHYKSWEVSDKHEVFLSLLILSLWFFSWKWVVVVFQTWPTNLADDGKRSARLGLTQSDETFQWTGPHSRFHMCNVRH